MVTNSNRSASYGMVPKVHLQKIVYKKGYHVTEACALTASNYPVTGTVARRKEIRREA